MQLRVQKKLASEILKCGETRIWLDGSRLEDIKEAITKTDVRSLINEGVIKAKPMSGVSHVRARKIIVQKRKGRKRGPGSVKGKKTARLPKKLSWMRSIRIQRVLLRDLRDKGLISRSVYQKIYKRAKSGFFRSRRHLKMYLDDNNLFSRGPSKKVPKR